uniref:Uncharacterized protein n=1 Tax=Oryza sativa subsp. japonica TaxID=39947 RepID=Q6H461_ORYSJ|nr:hypothetical protein [Oryza sativa Japonica Group]BAD26488.1 hypothetical protein [Oryza sativa Japonica Group]
MFEKEAYQYRFEKTTGGPEPPRSRRRVVLAVPSLGVGTGLTRWTTPPASPHAESPDTAIHRPSAAAKRGACTFVAQAPTTTSVPPSCGNHFTVGSDNHAENGKGNKPCDGSEPSNIIMLLEEAVAASQA